MTSNGEPFHFLPTAPDVLFCKGSTSMKKVIMTIQPDLLQSASKRRQTSASVAPPSLDQEKEDDHKASHQETSTSFHESIRVQHQPGNSSSKTSSLLHTYVLWLTVILFSGRSWRNPQCKKPGSTWASCNSWCTDGCKQRTSRHGRCSRCQHKL